MKGWNVVVSVREGRFSEACGLLENYGAVSKTEFYNVLATFFGDYWGVRSIGF